MTIATTMRALRTESAALAGLAPVDGLPVPTPGAGEVLLRVHAVSLNHRDLLAVEGKMAPPALPFVPGSDASGEVVALGAGTTRWRIGDRVMTTFVPGWHAGAPTPAQRGRTLGGALPGVLQDFVVASEEDLVRLPEGWSHEQASTLAIAALTAWAVLADGGLRPGSTVLTQGSGGVALFALQFAKAAGARVVALSSSEARLERLRALGADVLIDYSKQPHWQGAVRDATGGTGIDIVVETTGSTLGQSIAACALGGFVGVVGFVGGMASEVPVRQLLGGMVRVHGSFVGSRERFEQMVSALRSSPLHPVIDSVFELAEGRAAFEHLRSARHFGKVVIRLADR